MNDQTLAKLRKVNQHPRVGVGNDTPVWLNPRRTVYGVTLDGRYVKPPRYKTMEAALSKALVLIHQLEEQAKETTP